LGNPSAGYGPPVQYAPYSDAAESAVALEAHLEELVRQGVGLDEITILSTLPLSESTAWKMSPKWRTRIREITPSNAGHMPLPALTFAQIEDFKGLENRHIAAIDLDRFSATPRDLALVYVAMSRARAGLWVAYQRDLDDEIRQAAADRLAAANTEV
jgi:hypothetical protein